MLGIFDWTLLFLSFLLLVDLVWLTKEQDAIIRIKDIHSEIMAGPRAQHNIVDLLKEFKNLRKIINPTSPEFDEDLGKIVADLVDLSRMRQNSSNCFAEWLRLRKDLIAKYGQIMHLKEFIVVQSALGIAFCRHKIEHELENGLERDIDLNASIGWLRWLKTNMREVLPVSLNDNYRLWGNLPISVLAHGVTRYLQENGINLRVNVGDPLYDFLEMIDAKFERLIMKYCRIINTHFQDYSAYMEELIGRNPELRGVSKMNFIAVDWMESDLVCKNFYNYTGRDLYLLGYVDYRAVMHRLMNSYHFIDRPDETLDQVELLVMVEEARARALNPDPDAERFIPFHKVRDLAKISRDKCNQEMVNEFRDSTREFRTASEILGLLVRSARLQILECTEYFEEQLEPELMNIQRDKRLALSKLRNKVQLKLVGPGDISNKSKLENLVKAKFSRDFIEQMYSELNGEFVASLLQDEMMSSDTVMNLIRENNFPKLATEACSIILANLGGLFERYMEIFKLDFAIVDVSSKTMDFLIDYNICRQSKESPESSQTTDILGQS